MGLSKIKRQSIRIERKKKKKANKKRITDIHILTMMLSTGMYSSPHVLMNQYHRLPKVPRPIFPTRNISTTIRCFSSSKVATRFDLKTYWTTLINDINQKLEEAIPVKYPHQIYEAMRYSALAKGAKRAPPVLCVASCELFGGNRLAAFPTACALEMVCLP